MASEPTADDQHTTDRQPRVHTLDTYFRVFDNSDLSRVYYHARDGPVTVPELRDTIGLSKSSAYNYIDELVSAGLLREHDDPDGPTKYTATDWALTIEIDDNSLSLGPLTALVVATKTQYPPIEQLLDEYGLATLQEFITAAQAYERGDTTTRQLAADTDVRYGLTIDALTGLAELFGFESDSEPLTSEALLDDADTDDEIDLSELKTDDAVEDENSSATPLGLMERKRESDDTQ
ncbi:MAG: helix-turn-helix domain-containing protein [Haloarculaceae archaeon]